MSGHVIVFGREPIPGRVKTRLVAGIGPRRAAELYALLLEHTLREAQASGMAVTLALAEEPARGWRPPVDVPVVAQHGDSLGQRMAASFDHAFSAGARVAVLVGSDAPALRGEHLRAAAAACAIVPVALGPSADGGYYLVAQRAPGCDLFSGIPWSSSATLTRTLARLRALGTEFRTVPMLHDVDTAGDLAAVLTDPEVPAPLRAALAEIVAAAGRG